VVSSTPPQPISIDYAWHMIRFHGRDADFDPDKEIADLSTGRIGLATSNDGLEWKIKAGNEHKGCVLDVSKEWWTFDTAHVGLGDIIVGSSEQVHVCLYMYFLPQAVWSAPGFWSRCWTILYVLFRR
jgi:hypothetical protein